MRYDLQNNLIYKDGFDFCFDQTLCSQCEGNCCIGEPGYIWINKDEIENLAKYLNITTQELKYNYLKKVGYKYSIKELKLRGSNHVCIFFDTEKKQCCVYDARPMQCRTFPFWDYFKNNRQEVFLECQAVKEI